MARNRPPLYSELGFRERQHIANMIMMREMLDEDLFRQDTHAGRPMVTRKPKPEYL